ncbi:MAG: hypothetical protein QOF57_1641, partial [Frankiaceae bacterium]|nr:hypothetical protein [Frankiaceae bacterium]
MIDRRRGTTAFAGLAMAMLLSGCLSVPHSGKVQAAGGNATTAAANVPNEARIEAAPPVPGEQPDEIVHDFYGSMVDYGSGNVALQYLVAGATRPWPQMPTRTVVVSDVKYPELSPASARTNTHATYVLHFTKLGEVLPDHEFVVGTDSLTDTVDVVRDPAAGGDWRISRIVSTDGAGNVVPDVLRLSVADFNTVFHEATLYFPHAGTASAPVADRRWFPRRRADLPDAVARAYVDGPGSFLKADASVTALLPAGTTIDATVPLAPGQTGVAFRVPLADDSQGLRTQITDAMRTTFSQTASFPDVTGILVSVNGQAELMKPVPPSPDLPTASTVASSWFIDGQHLLRPWSDAPTSSDGAASTPARLDVTSMQHVSMSPNAQFAAGAVAAADGTSTLRVVSRNLGRRDVVLHASSVTSVRWNADGSGIWVAGAVGGRRAVSARPAIAGAAAVDAAPATTGTAAGWFVRVALTGTGSSASYSATAEPVSIDQPVAQGDNVLVDLRPSPDGVRISAIVQSGNKKRSDLYVGRIDGSGSTLALTTFRRVAPVLLPTARDKPSPVFTVAAAMWSDGQQLVLVARQGTATYSLWDATFDGSDVQPRNTTGLVNISDTTVFALAHDKHMLAL